MKHGVAGLKFALGLLGFEGTRPRRPVPSLDSPGRREIEAGMREAGLLDGKP